jgi:hypothetical protein
VSVRRKKSTEHAELQNGIVYVGSDDNNSYAQCHQRGERVELPDEIRGGLLACCLQRHRLCRNRFNNLRVQRTIMLHPNLILLGKNDDYGLSQFQRFLKLTNSKSRYCC